MKKTKLVLLRLQLNKQKELSQATDSILIISTYLDNEDSERGYLMNQESMHTGIRSQEMTK